MLKIFIPKKLEEIKSEARVQLKLIKDNIYGNEESKNQAVEDVSRLLERIYSLEATLYRVRIGLEFMFLILMAILAYSAIESSLKMLGWIK